MDSSSSERVFAPASSRPAAVMHAKLSALIGMDIDDYIDGETRAARDRVDAYARRVWKAMALTMDYVTCRALLAGERVPWQRLNYFDAERYGLRVRNTDGRYSLDDFNDVPAP